MTNEPPWDSELGQLLLNELIEKCLKKYKIDEDRATEIAIETIQKHPKFFQFRELLDTTPLDPTSYKKILKTSLYDDICRRVKQNIYYELRQYNKNSELQKTLIDSLKNDFLHSDHLEHVKIENQAEKVRAAFQELIKYHISTRERLPESEYFYSQVLQWAGDIKTIIDIGCGLNPLLFPFTAEGVDIRTYAALDKDAICIDTLSTYTLFSELPGQNAIRPFLWNIAEGWKPIRETLNIQQFDAAFLMKVVPVISRIERKLLDILSLTPAKTWFISGSKVSMTKYLKIESRERKFIHTFIQNSGKKIIGEFATADEFCFVVE